MLIERRGFLALLAALGIPAVRAGTDDEGGRIAAKLGPIREETGLPGLIAGVATLGQPTAVGAVGVRKVGSPEAFRPSDLVHLGSDTKAMTATMIATLVEEGLLRWSSTLGEVFPDSPMHADYRSVTLDQLLTHRAGLMPNGDWWGLGRDRSTTDQRRELLRQATKAAPETKPGTKPVYSNVGYALAGLMAETVTKRSWEALMKDRLFAPLGMTSAGFGVPGTPGRIDQPWGHQRKDGTIVPIQGDNSPALGPAGTVHCTLADWAKFLELHLRGARGEETAILTPPTFRELQAPSPGGKYAKGWVVTQRPWAGGKVLTHAGSNTLWFCVAWVAPARGVAYMAATNIGGKEAEDGTDRAIGAMIPS